MAIPTTYSQDFPSTINEATTRASALAGKAGQLASEMPNIGSLLKERAYGAYQQNQDIIQPLDQSTAAYFTSPQVAREKYQNIFNPFTREKLVGQATQNAALPMLSLSSILGNRMGRISDIIGGGTDAFKAQVLAEQAQAENAQNYVNNLLKQYQLESENIFKQQELNKKSSAGLDFTQLEALMNRIFNQRQNVAQTNQTIDPAQFDQPDQNQMTGSKPFNPFGSTTLPGGIEIPHIGANYGTTTPNLNLGNGPINLGINPNNTGLNLLGGYSNNSILTNPNLGLNLRL